MTLEGKNFTSGFGGKFSLDCKPCKYFVAKKLSVDSNGAFVCDLDVPNLVSGTTLMLRELPLRVLTYSSQGSAMEPSVSKVTVGMKYLSGRFASDINVDTIAKKYTSCAVVSVMLAWRGDP